MPSEGSLSGIVARLSRQKAQAHVGSGTPMVDLGYGDVTFFDMMLQMKIDYRGADIGVGSFTKVNEQGHVPLVDGGVFLVRAGKAAI